MAKAGISPFWIIAGAAAVAIGAWAYSVRYGPLMQAGDNGELPTPEEIRQRLITTGPEEWGFTPGEWAAAQILGAQMESF